MKFGLVSYRFRDGDMQYNMHQIEKAMQEACGKADALCFGEAFLQGFSALTWQIEEDRMIAVHTDSACFQFLKDLTNKYEMDLFVGYIENDDGRIYSSYAVLSKGRMIHNYRRISKGWKEVSIAGPEYLEGCDTSEFIYYGRHIKIALCGDLWDMPEKFKTDDILIWPVYVNFSLEDWASEENEYALQAKKAAPAALLVNSLSDDPVSHGNAFLFENGTILQRSRYDQENILIVEV